jgi:2-methylisocitrate lyase-like PEP mutase family enzyme
MTIGHGAAMRERLDPGVTLPCVGVYDVFSASLAARHFDALFLSGFGFAASHHGLPDIGFVTWPDMVSLVDRIRGVLPRHHLLVDIDDGYGDARLAAHVAQRLERAGASGVVLEDQQRPRRCGHLPGKQLLELDDYLAKLELVLAARTDLLVVARTDASDVTEALRRVQAFAAAGADMVLVDGVDLDVVRQLRAHVECPWAFNQIAGGKAGPRSLTEMADAGVGLAIYSTPCLFAAQQAMEDALGDLAARDGRLPGAGPGLPGVAECNTVLEANLAGIQLPPPLRPATEQVASV